MKIVFCLLTFWLGMTMANNDNALSKEGPECTHIGYEGGYLLNSLGVMCEFSSNGFNFTTSSLISKVPLKGLLKYKCNECYGELVVASVCDTCDGNCKQRGNEMYCETKYSLWIMGLTIGLTVAIFISMLSWYVVRLIEIKFAKKWDNGWRRLITRTPPGSDASSDESDPAIEPHVSRPPIRQTRPPMVPLCITLLALLSIADSSYVTSDNTYCRGTNCTKYAMLNLVLDSGEAQTFRSLDGNLMSIQLVGTKKVQMYQKVYKTSDYKITVSSKYNCKGAGKCWYDGDCVPYMKSDHFEWDSRVSDGGCLESSLGCSNYCWYDSACVYYKWILEEVGGAYDVYELSTTMWKLELLVNEDSHTYRYPLTSTNNIVTLDSGSHAIRVLITEPVQYQQQEHIMYYEGQYFYVKAAPRGKPKPDMVGDYQLDSTGQTMDVFQVTCQSVGCKVTCRSPQPYLEKFKSTRSLQMTAKVARTTYSTAIVEEPVQLTAAIYITAKPITQEMFVKAKCSFRVVSHWGCSSCGKQANIILKAYDIKTLGLVHMSSNCTMMQDYLPCQEEMIQLTITGQPAACAIDPSGDNNTMIVAMQYIDMDVLEPDYGVISTAPTEVGKFLDTLNSPDLISTLSETLMHGMILSLALLVARAAIIGYFLKQGKASGPA